MNWMDIEGYFEPGDALFVTNLCANIVGGLVVELGSFCGRSTVVMGSICARNGTRLVTIDNFKGGTEEQDHAGDRQRRSSTKADLQANIKRFRLDHCVEVMESDSAEAAKGFDDGSVFLCFIDADHMESSVRADMDAWWPKIQSRGILAGHDYRDVRSEYVKKVVDSFVESHGLELETGGMSCWSVRKP